METWLMILGTLAGLAVAVATVALQRIGRLESERDAARDSSGVTGERRRVGLARALAELLKSGGR